MRQQKEIWKPIKGYEGRYHISNIGRIRADKTNHILKPYLEKKYNRYRIKLRPENTPRTHRGKAHLISNLVAEAFIGPKPKGYEVNHKDGIKTNDCVSNLEYSTRIENMAHAKKAGLLQYGEQINTAKLNKSKVLQIRSIYDFGFADIKELAEIYNMSITAIIAVVKRKTWKHI